MIILFNYDGSIKTLIVSESINQGSNNVNKVYAAIEGHPVEDYSCNAIFELPNGDLEQLAGTQSTFTVDDTEYDGYEVSLAESVTIYAGNLKMNLKLLDLADNVLCTYQVKLKVNPTGYEPNTTFITEAQYNALLQSLNSYQLKTNEHNFRFYPSLANANADVDNLATGQHVLVLTATSQYSIYKKAAASDEELTFVVVIPKTRLFKHTTNFRINTVIPCGVEFISTRATPYTSAMDLPGDDYIVTPKQIRTTTTNYWRPCFSLKMSSGIAYSAIYDNEGVYTSGQVFTYSQLMGATNFVDTVTEL